VKNWDGTVAGVPDGSSRSFDDLSTSKSANSNTAANIDGGSGGGSTPRSTLAGEPGGASSSSTAGNGTSGGQQCESDDDLKPFAKVNSVAADSPAYDAGLHVDDLIVKFGDIVVSSNSTDDPIRAVGELVPVVAGQKGSVQVVVRRKSTTTTETERLTLEPRPWSGRGLLGCHIVTV